MIIEEKNRQKLSSFFTHLELKKFLIYLIKNKLQQNLKKK